MAKAIKPVTPTKKSPKLSGPEQVAAFMQGTQHPLKKVMEILRDIILTANTKLTEQVKWNAPSFCINGDDRITFNLSKKEKILIIFHRGAKVKDTNLKGRLFSDDTGLLEWLADDRAVVKLSGTEDVLAKKATIKKLVNTWIKATTE